MAKRPRAHAATARWRYNAITHSFRSPSRIVQHACRELPGASLQPSVPDVLRPSRERPSGSKSRWLVDESRAQCEEGARCACAATGTDRRKPQSATGEGVKAVEIASSFGLAASRPPWSVLYTAHRVDLALNEP